MLTLNQIKSTMRPPYSVEIAKFRAPLDLTIQQKGWEFLYNQCRPDFQGREAIQMRSSNQVWLIFYLACVWWRVCGCADNPTRSTHSRTVQTNAEAEPQITSLELGVVLIPAGEFLMGSENGQKDEQPVHRVFLDAYEVDLYIVTNEQYARFMKATDHPPPPHWNDRRFKKP